MGLNRGRSVSTLLLVFAGALAITAVLQILPLQLDMSRTAKRNAVCFECWEWIVRAGAPAWAVGTFLLMRWRTQLHLNRRLHGTTTVELAKIPELTEWVAKFEEFPALDSTEFLLEGNPDRIRDDGGELLLSPLAAQRWGRKGKSRNVVLVPALFWKRYLRYPNALAAVLFHELSHFENRDLLLLFDVSRFLVAVSLTVAVCTAATLVSSILIDGGLDGGRAILASLIGKNYFLSNILLLLLTILFVRRLQIWREALADATTVQICGEESLLEAERLVWSSDPLSDPRSSNKGRAPLGMRSKASILTLPDMFILGLVLSAVCDGISAVLSPLQGMPWPLVLTFQTAGGLYFGFYLALTVVRNGLGPDWLSFSAPRALFLTFGAATGTIVFQTGPLFFTSVAMPNGYDYFFRHDLGPLAISGIITSLTTSASAASLALVGSLISFMSGRRCYGWIIGFCWSLATTLEFHFYPLLEGWLSLGITAAVVSFCFLKARSTTHWFSIRGLLFCTPLIGASCAYWAGFGDVNHLAACASAAALHKWNSTTGIGDLEGAIRSARRGAARAPFHAAGWLQVAKLLLDEKTRTAEVAEIGERALRAPYMSAWNEKFVALCVTGTARLTLRTSADLVLAEKYFSQAEELWRRNGRFDHVAIAEMLYQYACTLALLSRDQIEPTARLIEAATLDRQVAFEALTDSDLSSLALSEKPSPRENTIALFNTLTEVSAPAIIEMAKMNRIPNSEVEAVLALMLRQR
jgi:Peptidase family M48